MKIFSDNTSGELVCDETRRQKKCRTRDRNLIQLLLYNKSSNGNRTGICLKSSRDFIFFSKQYVGTLQITAAKYTVRNPSSDVPASSAALLQTYKSLSE